MKKLLVLLLAAPLFFIACSDDNDFIENPPAAGEEYADTNTKLTDGKITADMTFRGNYVVTDKNGVKGYENPMAEFEVKAEGESMALYMHSVKFAQVMPALDIRMRPMEYAGTGRSLRFDVAKILPEAYIKAANSWQLFDKYPMTEVKGEINDTQFKVKMVCMGIYTISFEGRLLK